jgi:hypothetical protein
MPCWRRTATAPCGSSPRSFGISTDDASQTDRSDELEALWHKLDARGDVDAGIFHTDITGIDYDHYGWLAVVQNRETFHPYRVWCDFARLRGAAELPRVDQAFAFFLTTRNAPRMNGWMRQKYA